MSRRKRPLFDPSEEEMKEARRYIASHEQFSARLVQLVAETKAEAVAEGLDEEIAEQIAEGRATGFVEEFAETFAGARAAVYAQARQEARLEGRREGSVLPSLFGSVRGFHTLLAQWEVSTQGSSSSESCSAEMCDEAKRSDERTSRNAARDVGNEDRQSEFATDALRYVTITKGVGEWKLDTALTYEPTEPGPLVPPVAFRSSSIRTQNPAEDLVSAARWLAGQRAEALSQGGDVAPLCCSFLHAAFALCQSKLQLHQSAYLESTVAKWSHNAFALTNSRLDECKPRLYLDDMVSLGDAKEHVAATKRKVASRLPGAALLSWCPSSGFSHFPACVRQGILVACEVKRRLFPSEWTTEQVVGQLRTGRIAGDLAAALEESARDAMGRLRWVDPMGKLPYCFAVVTDGVWWLFLALCVVRGKQGMLFHLRVKYATVRKSTDDWTGIVLDLQRMMLISCSQPTYRSPVRCAGDVLHLGELRVKPREVLSGLGDTLVLLCDATRGTEPSRPIVVKLRGTRYCGHSADKVAQLHTELTSRCDELIDADKKKDVSTIASLEAAIDEIHKELSALNVDEPKVELVLRVLAETNALSVLWTLVGDSVDPADGGIVLPVAMNADASSGEPPSLHAWEGAVRDLGSLMIGTVMAGHGTPLGNVCRCHEGHRRKIVSAVAEQGRALLHRLHEGGHALVGIHQGNLALVGDCVSDADPRILFIDVESLSPLGRACRTLYKMGSVRLGGRQGNVISGSVDLASLSRLQAHLEEADGRDQ
jgi:hypothetical protein